MNALRVFFYRTYQVALKGAMAFLRIPLPFLLDRVEELGAELKDKKLKHPLIVTDKGLASFPAFLILKQALDEAEITYEVYDGAVPNPTFACIEEGVKRYREAHCDALIAYGGGSPMDCAKGIAILASYPKKSLQAFKGVLHVHRKLPYLLAIPTTVGTGSEATLAAVVLNESTKDKFQIDSPRLVPNAALLDPRFVQGLPKGLIASTGMDAFTHALEAYLGRGGTKFSDKYALSALKGLHEHLYAFYEDPTSKEHAFGMQKAAYEAGVAFTRAFVGYVHALAHALGGAHGVPHGLANAVLLVPTLKKYGKSIEKKLARIAPIFGVQGQNNAESAANVLAYLEDLERKMNLPKGFKDLVKDPDLDALAKHAAKEGNPFYPVPKILTRNELKDILQEVCI